MNEWKDKASAIIKISTDILFVRNPVGTSMGVVFGIVLHAITSLFTPFLQSIEFIKLSALNILHYMALGVFGFNVKHFKNQHKINPEIEEAIKFIENQEAKGNISKLEAKLRYRELVSKVVENVQLDKSTKQAVEAIRGLEE
ncbi:hypothetical protein [Marichromatium sp. AB31]|uniref:hypothetical protein n=1 Tax=Marichromatium sp. AB31 TaxID=2483362 RepID=UPI0011CD96CB|nr:hypothetical protein [Marichromatium sp. AB31]